MRHIARATMPLALFLGACSDDAATNPSLNAAARVQDAAEFPAVIPLPRGFTPEGIAFGRGTTFYVTSIFSASIVQLDALSGARTTLVPAQPGRQHAGVKYDRQRDRLIVAGGETGLAYIYNASNGAPVAEYQLSDRSTGPTLVNDLVLASDAAYFTDSFRPVIYRLPLPPNGALPPVGAAQTIPLTGDYDFEPTSLIAGNYNGIAVTPDERQLIVVNTTTGALSLVDALSGQARRIELGGASMEGGDGILLVGHTLYVVQGHLNQIAVIRLSADFASGQVERAISSPTLRFPATIDAFAGALYAVNARFDAAEYPDVEFEVVRVPR